MEDMTIKTEGPYDTVSDCAVKIEASTQAPDIKLDTITTLMNSNTTQDLEHTAREDVTIKTEVPWNTAADCSMKREASTQSPDIKWEKFTSTMEEESESDDANSRSVCHSSAYCQPHSSAADFTCEGVLVTQPDSSDMLQTSYSDNQIIDNQITDKTFTGENLHRCNMCRKTFICAKSLKQHISTHTGDTPHECNICNVCTKIFRKASHLKQHILVHNSDKPHECNICQKTFTQANTLKQHMLTHSGDKPYKCNICQKPFTQASNLKRHMLTHTGEVPVTQPDMTQLDNSDMTQPGNRT